MRSPLVALGLAVLLVLGASALLSQADERLAPASLAAAGATSYDATVVSFDGVELRITVYRPEGASDANPVPVVLHGHGWGGSRIRDGTGLPGRLWAEGFGVVTIDSRGHGESGGVAMVQHEDAEVKDLILILDWIHDNLDWVQKESASGIPKDVVAGGAGYSYAGAMQLQLASHDPRLDAIAPEMTWTDLTSALAPEGVPKSVWLDALIMLARESGTRYDPRIDSWYASALLANEVPQEALDHFAGSSPHLDAIGADVLFIQGMPDVLFNLNQALRGYQALEARGESDVRLVTHLTGHVLPTAQPLGTSPTRRETFQEEGPCGRTTDLVVAWLDEKLRGGPPSGIPEVSYALDEGGCVAFDALPSRTQDVELGILPVPSGAGALVVPLLDGPALLAGVPRLAASTDLLAAEATAFVGFAIAGADGNERIVDDQTQPIRLVPGQPIELDLVGIAARLEEGDRLLLRIDGLNEWYLHNGQRAPAAALLGNVVVTLPIAG